MRIAILGASGRTGGTLVDQALERGHEVVALVRTPAKTTVTGPGPDRRRSGRRASPSGRRA
ncbi:NAD(P)H-binding protein [Streptomyces sp. NPDC006703]|uniref:NAD(P)H-binding protein n=1 Tax=Streptomyces sp. NPDC006703 TaxID=3364759 RepID=UPI0036AA9411